MSRSDDAFSPEYQQPGALRYDLPRYTMGEYGALVMEPLRTEDLPEPPPRSPGTWDTRLMLTLGGLMLLVFSTATAVIFIRMRSLAIADIADESSAAMREQTSIFYYKATREPINATSDAPTLDSNTTFTATEALNETWSI
ncbi:uncharacterized protein [Dermacentor albipictus]|uniref:uncharacterized protein n=1 Tax=Dermacentor albipictus TaxID=60249 RepID=UPI0031FD70FE